MSTATSRFAVMHPTEKQFQASFLELAHVLGWRTYHTHDSRKSAAGFPDVVLVHARKKRTLFVELKTETGRAPDEQMEWLNDLARAGQEAYLFRPSDMNRIEQVLKAEKEA